MVLQEQSTRPKDAPEKYLDYATRFGNLAKSNNAIPLLYVLWGQKGGSTTHKTLTAAATTALKGLQDGKGVAELAPVGETWAAIRDFDSTIELHQPDGNHSTNAGAYLTACVFFCVIHRESPRGLPPEIKTSKSTLTVSAREAELFQKHAWDVSEKWRRKTRVWYLQK